MKSKETKLVLIGLGILIAASLNFFLLNKVIGSSNNQTFEHRVELKN